jgi:hypothetical protein
VLLIITPLYLARRRRDRRRMAALVAADVAAERLALDPIEQLLGEVVEAPDATPPARGDASE